MIMGKILIVLWKFRGKSVPRGKVYQLVNEISWGHFDGNLIKQQPQRQQQHLWRKSESSVEHTIHRVDKYVFVYRSMKLGNSGITKRANGILVSGWINSHFLVSSKYIIFYSNLITFFSLNKHHIIFSR